MPDERWGEAPHAFVVLEAGATATETELRNYARDHLAHFKCPQKIHFLPELPKTATGKVQKYVLRGKPAISKQDNTRSAHDPNCASFRPGLKFRRRPP